MPTQPVQRHEPKAVQRDARKAEIVEALQKVCGELGSLPAAKAERDLYRAVEKFLGVEIRRLRRKKTKRSP